MKEQQEEQGGEVELMKCRKAPAIPSRPPIVAEVAPVEGLGCEVLVGAQLS